MRDIYVGVEVFQSMYLREYVAFNSIPQAMEDRQVLHSTIFHSTNVVDLRYLRKCRNTHTATPVKFTTLPHKGTHALVLLLECDTLIARHAELKAAGLVHRYDDYQPHITLSYDIANFDWQSLPPITREIKLGHESIRGGGKRLFHRTPAWTQLQEHLMRVMKGNDDRCILA